MNENISPQKHRDSNLELLRIVCMLMIIAHHFVVHGGSAFIGDWSTNQIISLVLLPGGKIAFICFLAISCYFLVDSEFKSKRFIRIWLEVLFYSVLFTVVSFGYGKDIKPNEWVSVFFPIIGNSHGFAAAYLAFYLLIPLLCLAINHLKDRQILYFALLLIYFEVMTKLFGAYTNYVQYFSSELVLFITIFFVMAYLKKHPPELINNRLFCIVVIALIWAYACVISYHSLKGETWGYFQVFQQLITDESSLLYIISGILLFYLFKNTDVKYSPSINTVASCTFGVLLMHDHNFFRSVLWKDILHVQDWYHSDQFVLFLIVTVIMVFIIFVIIDYIRQKTLEKWIMNSSIVNIISTKWDSFLKDINGNT